jgi:uncharacterized protein YdaU (DUF1376 family)
MFTICASGENLARSEDRNLLQCETARLSGLVWNGYSPSQGSRTYFTPASPLKRVFYCVRFVRRATKIMHFYPHNIADFNNSTRHLTRVERSVYRDAMDLYYDTEQPLDSDVEALQRRLICASEDEKKALSVVLKEFFRETEQGFYHSRCELEIQKYQRNTSAKARAGIASAAKRQQKSTDREQNSTRVCNQEPITNNQELREIGAVAPSRKFVKPSLPELIAEFGAQQVPEPLRVQRLEGWQECDEVLAALGDELD